VSEYEPTSFDYVENAEIQRPLKSKKSIATSTAKAAPKLWPALAGLFLLASLVLSVMQGVTLLSFLFSLTASVLVVVGLFVDRYRAASASYSFEPWFNRVSPFLYLSSVLVAIAQIVLVAYEAAK
jgi:hypothetical protein